MFFEISSTDRYYLPPKALQKQSEQQQLLNMALGIAFQVVLVVVVLAAVAAVSGSNHDQEILAVLWNSSIVVRTKEYSVGN